MPNLVRQLKTLRYRLFYGALIRRGYPLVSLGEPSTGCRWTICPEGLNASSVIYSGGVGRDVTFEHALVRNFGCSIALFDPSPTGWETMSKPENKIPQFTFHPVALAGRPGMLNLAPPLNAEEGSWFAQTRVAGTMAVPCLDLSTLLRQNGHDHLDLLKLDIEGTEYEVLDHLLQRRLPVRQVAVEFHHANLPGIRRIQTVRSILKMTAAGYKLLKQEGSNHTFLRPKAQAFPRP